MTRGGGVEDVEGGSENFWTPERGAPKICRQTDRQTDMFLFGVLYKESTLTTIPNR